MEKQLRFVSKEEAHKLIDEVPGNGVLVLTYDNMVGISDKGRYIKKRKSKRLVDKSVTLVLTDSRPVVTLNLHDKIIRDFSGYDRENIVKTIMLTQLE